MCVCQLPRLPFYTVLSRVARFSVFCVPVSAHRQRDRHVHLLRPGSEASAGVQQGQQSGEAAGVARGRAAHSSKC